MHRPAPNPFVRTAVLAYTVIAASSIAVIILWLGRSDLLAPGGREAAEALFLGTVSALPVEIISALLFRTTQWTRELSTLLRGITGELSTPQIALVALGSGIGEEALFRGIIQTVTIGWMGPAGGIALTSVLFGLMHVPPRRQLAGWTVFAALMGVWLGVLTWWTGNILAATATHVLVNFVNLHVVMRMKHDWRPGNSVPPGSLI